MVFQFYKTIVMLQAVIFYFPIYPVVCYYTYYMR